MGWRDGMQGDDPQGTAGRHDQPPSGGHGDGPAFRGLLDRWFDACVDVARHVLDDGDAAVEVATETFATAWEREVARRPPAAAGTWLLGTARERALGRRSRGSRPPAAPALRLGGPAPLDEGADLAQAVLAALGPADASVLSLHLRHDLDVAAIAEVLATSPNDARERLLSLKRRLGGAVRAWAMWPRGRPGGPRCSVLHRELEAAGVTEFGPDAVRVLGRHAAACPMCRGARRGTGSSPEAAFGAVPILPAGPAVAAGAVAALAARGIPVGAPGRGPTRVPLALPPAPAAPEPAGRGAHAEHRPPAPGDPETPSAPPPGPPRPPTRGRGLVAVGLTALAVAGASLVAARDGSDGLDEARTAAGRVVAATSTTAAPSTATSTTAVGPLAGTPSSTDPPPPADAGTTITTVAPPTTLPPTTMVPAPQPGAPAPVVTAFAVAEQGLGSPCEADQRRIVLVWEADNADAVTIGGEGAPAGALSPSGSTVVCRDQGPPVTYTLYATGAGGTVTRTAAA